MSTKPTTYDTAYPGSMSEREDGEYISRNDAPSLAAGLLQAIERLTCEAGNANDALDQMRNDMGSLVEAVVWLEMFYPREGENANERFERIGDAFYADTGRLRPGKDSGGYDSHEERQAVWDAWIASNLKRVRGVIMLAMGYPA